MKLDDVISIFGFVSQKLRVRIFLALIGHALKQTGHYATETRETFIVNVRQRLVKHLCAETRESFLWSK